MDTVGPFQHVVVVGPGAIGLCFAVRLATGPGGGEAGAAAVPPPRVTVVDHDPQRALRLGGRAVRLVAEDGVREVRLPVATAPREPPDLVILATKAPQARRAAESARAWIGRAPVLTLQNGLGVAEEVAEALPATPVVVGVTYQAANTVAEGEVHHAADLPTHLGYPGRPPDAVVEAVARLLEGAGLAACVEADIRPVQWRKLLVNAALNPVAALAGVRNGEVAERPALAALAAALAEEGEAVARAEGVPLAEPAAEAVLRTARATAENRCSMLQDLEAGRPTEIGYLNGALVRLAEAHGVAAPVHRAVVTLVERVSASASASSGRGAGESPRAGPGRRAPHPPPLSREVNA